MTANEYQEQAISMDVRMNAIETQFPAAYSFRHKLVAIINLQHATLGLTEEAGEVAGKIKKHLRKEGTIDTLNWKEIVLELGDLFWYAAVIAHMGGYSLEDVLTMNIEKLRGRENRGVIIGEGDHR